ncbi:MAG: D-aminoacylase [Chloroflexi bacterium]|nr:D-aminoacylase [Chloroflexota bacterium]
MSENAYDLLIRGGTVYDGTGSPGAPADVGIRDGVIVAVGDIDGAGNRTIDAGGMSIAPGFIDVHAHDDAAILGGSMDFKLLQGVTTDIVGNCGAGVAPMGDRLMPGAELVLGSGVAPTWSSFGEYMEEIDRSSLALNVGCLVPHGAVRFRRMGMDARAPTDGEMSEMRADVAEGMEAGALGLSTGLIYPPGTFAKTREIIELARVAAAAGGIYASHIRNEADGLLDAVAEAIAIGGGAGLPVHISHHKASGQPNWGKTKESIELIETRRDQGIDITFDAYPYVAASTVLSAMARRPEAADPDSVLVASVREKHEYEGKTIAQIAEMLDLPPADAVRRVLSEEPQAIAVFFVMDEADVRRVLGHRLCMIGSDGIPSATGKPHPRLYGTFARVLGTYCRTERLFPLEEALRKMTSLPAKRFGLSDRGAIGEGKAADIVVFDPETIEDVATYEEPRKHPAGIQYVIVNGQVAVDEGRQTEARAGELLRRS